MSEIAAVHNPGLAKAGKSFASHTCRRGSIMFAIWVVTLHLPSVLGLYGIPARRTIPTSGRVYLSPSRCGEVGGASA
jgi:hypothetical protein